nr:MAG TPA: Lower baseplate protein N-terminal domain [Caudoviricetes sp.]
MSIDFSKGISVASGFSLIAQSPLDARFVAETLDDLNELVTKHAAYVGLIAYVKGQNAFYKCVKDVAGGSEDLPTFDGCWVPLLEGQAVDSTVVHKSGDETIGGTKTFTTAPKINTETVTTKEYVDGQFVEKVTNEIGKSLQAHHDQLDKLSAFEEQGLIHRSTEGAFKGITVSGEKGVAVTLDPVGGTLKVGLAEGGVAGTFFKVTTDAQGRVTKGENPTKLDEFGIVDAVHKTGDTMSGVLKYAGTIDESAFDANTLVTKKYADNVALGFVFHDACKAGATTNIEGTYQTGSQSSKPGVGATFTTSVKTFGGVTVQQNDRVLLVGQTDKKQNGAYVVTSVADQVVLTRAQDFDGDPAISFNGASFLIADGDNKGQVWRLSNIGTLTFGTTELEFVQIFAPTQLIAGDGISVNSATISVAQGNTVKVIGGKVEVASGDNNNGKVLIAGANGTAASWKSFTIDDIATGVLPIAKGGTGHANTDEKVMQVGAIKLKTASTSDVFVPTTGTLATLAGSEVLTNKTVKADVAGQTALAVQNGDIVGEAYGEGKVPELKGFIIDCGTY